VKFNDTIERLSENYFYNYEGEWMPCEYILSYQNLSDLRIDNKPDELTITAFKDFKSKSMNQFK
jgi:hypothetical protein